MTGLGGTPSSAALRATIVLDGSEDARSSTTGSLSASLTRGVEVKARVATAKAALEQVRLEAVTRAQAVLDVEAPEADAASREALAAALTVPALAPGIATLQTASALTVLMAATRATEGAQATAAALRAEAAASASPAGDGAGDADGPGSGWIPLTPGVDIDQIFEDQIDDWIAQQPPLPTCEESPQCRGY